MPRGRGNRRPISKPAAPSQRRDLYPQLLSATLATSAADVTTSVEVKLPISNQASANASGRAQALEILKVYISFPSISTGLQIATQAASLNRLVALSTRNHGTVIAPGSDPHVIMNFADAKNFGTDVGEVYLPDSFVVDLSDGAGHGVLVGGSSLFLQYKTTGFGVVDTVDIKIMYRTTNVDSWEWFGMLAQQTSAT
jgi:hypothetical protein